MNRKFFELMKCHVEDLKSVKADQAGLERLKDTLLSCLYTAKTFDVRPHQDISGMEQLLKVRINGDSIEISGLNEIRSRYFSEFSS
jgi:hypothetical protein